MSLRRRIAALLRDGVRVPPPFIDDRLGHPHGNQAGRNVVACPEHDGLFQQRAGVLCKPVR